MYTGMTYNLYRYDGYDVTNNNIIDGWESNDAYVWEWEDVFSADTRFSTYTIVTDIVEVANGPINMLYDYQQQKYCMRTLHYRKGWTGLTNEEKGVVIDWHAHPDVGNGTQDTEKVIYLMTVKGMSQADAGQYLMDVWHANWVKFLSNCPDRWNLVVKVVAEYLELDDASDLSDTVDGLKGQYLVDGRLGLEYGDSQNGIMDYIMATNMYEDDGLEHNLYTLKKGTWKNFKDELENNLVCMFFLDEMNVIKPTV